MPPPCDASSASPTEQLVTFAKNGDIAHVRALLHNCTTKHGNTGGAARQRDYNGAKRGDTCGAKYGETGDTDGAKYVDTRANYRDNGAKYGATRANFADDGANKVGTYGATHEYDTTKYVTTGAKGVTDGNNFTGVLAPLFLDVNGADPHDSMRRPALYWAASRGEEGLCRLLLDHGADPNRVTSRHASPLHAAADSGSLDVVRLLLERGADVDAKKVSGYTALHMAATRGELDVCRLLLEHGASPVVSNPEGRTPIMDARANQRQQVVALLEQYCEGTQPNAPGPNASSGARSSQDPASRYGPPSMGSDRVPSMDFSDEGPQGAHEQYMDARMRAHQELYSVSEPERKQYSQNTGPVQSRLPYPYRPPTPYLQSNVSQPQRSPLPPIYQSAQSSSVRPTLPTSSYPLRSPPPSYTAQATGHALPQPPPSAVYQPPPPYTPHAPVASSHPTTQSPRPTFIPTSHQHSFHVSNAHTPTSHVSNAYTPTSHVQHATGKLTSHVETASYTRDSGRRMGRLFGSEGPATVPTGSQSNGSGLRCESPPFTGQYRDQGNDERNDHRVGVHDQGAHKNNPGMGITHEAGYNNQTPDPDCLYTEASSQEGTRLERLPSRGREHYQLFGSSGRSNAPEKQSGSAVSRPSNVAPGARTGGIGKDNELTKQCKPENATVASQDYERNNRGVSGKNSELKRQSGAESVHEAETKSRLQTNNGVFQRKETVTAGSNGNTSGLYTNGKMDHERGSPGKNVHTSNHTNQLYTRENMFDTDDSGYEFVDLYPQTNVSVSAIATHVMKNYSDEIVQGGDEENGRGTEKETERKGTQGMESEVKETERKGTQGKDTEHRETEHRETERRETEVKKRDNQEFRKLRRQADSGDNENKKDEVKPRHTNNAINEEEGTFADTEKEADYQEVRGLDIKPDIHNRELKDTFKSGHTNNPINEYIDAADTDTLGVSSFTSDVQLQHQRDRFTARSSGSSESSSKYQSGSSFAESTTEACMEDSEQEDEDEKRKNKGKKPHLPNNMTQRRKGKILHVSDSEEEHENAIKNTKPRNRNAGTKQHAATINTTGIPSAHAMHALQGNSPPMEACYPPNYMPENIPETNQQGSGIDEKVPVAESNYARTQQKTRSGLRSNKEAGSKITRADKACGLKTAKRSQMSHWLSADKARNCSSGNSSTDSSSGLHLPGSSSCNIRPTNQQLDTKRNRKGKIFHEDVYDKGLFKGDGAINRPIGEPNRLHSTNELIQDTPIHRLAPHGTSNLAGDFSLPGSGDDDITTSLNLSEEIPGEGRLGLHRHDNNDRNSNKAWQTQSQLARKNEQEGRGRVIGQCEHCQHCIAKQTQTQYQGLESTSTSSPPPRGVMTSTPSGSPPHKQARALLAQQFAPMAEETTHANLYRTLLPIFKVMGEDFRQGMTLTLRENLGSLWPALLPSSPDERRCPGPERTWTPERDFTIVETLMPQEGPNSCGLFRVVHEDQGYILQIGPAAAVGGSSPSSSRSSSPGDMSFGNGGGLQCVASPISSINIDRSAKTTLMPQGPPVSASASGQMSSLAVASSASAGSAALTRFVESSGHDVIPARLFPSFPLSLVTLLRDGPIGGAYQSLSSSAGSSSQGRFPASSGPSATRFPSSVTGPSATRFPSSVTGPSATRFPSSVTGPSASVAGSLAGHPESERFVLHAVYQVLHAVLSTSNNSVDVRGMFYDDHMRLHVILTQPQSTMDWRSLQGVWDALIQYGRRWEMTSSFSAGLQHVLGILKQSTDFTTLSKCFIQVGMMLFGPTMEEVQNETDCDIWLQCKMMKLLVQPPKQIRNPETSDASPSLQNSLDQTHRLLEMDFVTKATGQQIWNNR